MMITQKKGAVEYLTAPGLGSPHGFTTRYGGVSTGIMESLNLTYGRGDSMENVEANLRILADAIGFDPNHLVLTRQTHSDIVRVVDSRDRMGLCHKVYPECDALVTATPGLALMCFTADCTPILLEDPVTGAVAAIHAGWRGTAQSIAGKALSAMVQHFGTRPENVRAAIGPNIGPCHFETDRDVPDALVQAFGPQVYDFIAERNGKYFPDLKAINALALERAGVVQIDLSSDCTYCQCDRFWSHRASSGQRGSQGAVIVCRGGRL